MEMLHKSVNDFTAALASKASVPGGGSASALAGALAAALGGMVGELTVGKKKYAAVEPILRELLDEAEKLRGQLLECVEKDAAALAPLAKAYAIPKDDPQRAETLEACLTAAAAPPMADSGTVNKIPFPGTASWSFSAAMPSRAGMVCPGVRVKTTSFSVSPRPR